jgi:putative membrane protein
MKTLPTFLVAIPLALGAAGAWAAGVTDAQIAGFLVAANQTEIDAGRLAQSKAQSKDVQAFAQRMVAEHTDMNKSLAGLDQKAHIAPAEDAYSGKLKTRADQTLAELRTLQGSAFDKRYLDHEVYFHKAIVEELDKRLIPAAQNAELKGLLDKARPACQGHLEHAQKLQKEVEKTG